MNMRLMIVDDSNMMRSRIARVCMSGQLPACEVVALAKNGEEAVSACDKFSPNVVTMDLTMPQMDGIACIDVLAHKYPQLLILVISALSDKSTAIRALKMGAHGFLYKPFSDEQLISSLKELTN